MPQCSKPILHGLLGLTLACFVAGVTFAGEAASQGIEGQVTEGYVNAPLAEVWRVFTTPEGLRTTGVAQAAVDLKVGGTIRFHDDPRGQLGDPAGWVLEVLAYDPQRMLATRIRTASAKFPHADQVQGLWTVTYFTASGEDMTHVKMVALGYSADTASEAVKKAIAEANRRTLDTVAKRYWPKCKLCTTEPAATAEK